MCRRHERGPRYCALLNANLRAQFTPRLRWRCNSRNIQYKMDLYIFCVVLGAAGMAAMAFLGFTSSHSGGHHGHDTSGHELHGVGGSHTVGPGHVHTTAPSHGVAPSHHTGEIGGKAYNVTHYPVATGHGELHVHLPHDSSAWRSHVWSWLSPR